MKIKPGILWMATGAAALLACILMVWHFHSDVTPATQLAFKARRADLVGRMQLDLVSASEAEKSAVLAITDQDSQAFADQARADSAKVEQARREMGELLATGGTQGEKDLLAQFTTAFTEFRRIDKELLALAVKNTNLKAYSLAFGPAATALKEMDAALARFMTDDVQVLRLADNARIAAWRLLTLLPPHIAEEDEKKEDEMEAAMAAEDAQVRKNLEALAKFSNDSAFVTAAAHYAEFSKLKTQIIALSRENTNVRSLSISLHQKRKVMLVCQDALSALQQAILVEPIAGITYGIPVSPR